MVHSNSEHVGSSHKSNLSISRPSGKPVLPFAFTNPRGGVTQVKTYVTMRVQTVLNRTLISEVHD